MSRAMAMAAEAVEIVGRRAVSLRRRLLRRCGGLVGVSLPAAG